MGEPLSMNDAPPLLPDDAIVSVDHVEKLVRGIGRLGSIVARHKPESRAVARSLLRPSAAAMRSA